MFWTNWSFVHLRNPVHILVNLVLTYRYTYIPSTYFSTQIYTYTYAFFIFLNTVFPTYPESHDTKEGFCFLIRGTKAKFFLAVKLKKISVDASLIFIKTVMLLLSWHKILFANINWCQVLKFISVTCSFSLYVLICWGLFYNYLTFF